MSKGEATSRAKRVAPERDHDFTLALENVAELTAELSDRLFEAGCDDATPSERSGRVFLTFTRAAASVREAVVSAICDVKKAGCDVSRVMGCELVTQSEIARKTRRSRQLVHQWISGDRGPGGFPPPECFITESHPLWSWCDVAGWLHQNSIVKLEVLLEAQETERINLVLAYARMTKMEPDLFREVIDRIYGDARPKPPPTTGRRRRSTAG